MKAKKPSFLMIDWHKRKEVNKDRWRKPRGNQSKIRLNRRGKPKSVRTGYGSPAAVKYLDHNGLKPVVVSNVNELAGLTKENTVVISGSVGNRKKIAIINAASEKGLKVSNFKEPQKFVTAVLENVKNRQQAAKEKKAKVVKKTPEAKAKPAEKAPELSEEDKKKQETKDLEKTITKRV
ncbi:MAG: eL32 family ribosomal protein [Candidatus Woesearchaeota archaeon]